MYELIELSVSDSASGSSGCV